MMAWCRSLLVCMLAPALPLLLLAPPHQAQQLPLYLRHPLPPLLLLRNLALALFLQAPKRQPAPRHRPVQLAHVLLEQVLGITSASATFPVTMVTAPRHVPALLPVLQSPLLRQLAALDTPYQEKTAHMPDCVHSLALMVTVRPQPARLQIQQLHPQVVPPPLLRVKFALQVRGQGTMLGFVISAAIMVTVPRVLALARLPEHQFRRHQLREPMDIRYPVRIAVIWGYVASLVIMGIALQRPVRLAEH
jgi:hypothetical protein